MSATSNHLIDGDRGRDTTHVVQPGGRKAQSSASKLPP